MKLIFIHGLPGVGKLTIARELAYLTGFKLFHNHLVVDLVESIFEFGSLPFVELREMIWLEVFSSAARQHLPGLIFTFAYDRTVRTQFIENMLQVVEPGGSVSFVELRCSAEELEKRIAQPSRKEFGKLDSIERFRELKDEGVFVCPVLPAGGVVVETTGITAAEAATQIFSRLALREVGR